MSGDGSDKAVDRVAKKPNGKAATLTGDWKPIFLAKLGETGNVTLSADCARVSSDTAYNHRKSDPGFAAGWRRALKRAGDVLEAEARRRGVEGVTEPIYQSGKKVGEVQRYSDTLLIFLLKGCRPQKYRDNYHLTHVGRNGGPIESEVTVRTNLADCLSKFEQFAQQGVGGGPIPPNRS